MKFKSFISTYYVSDVVLGSKDNAIGKLTLQWWTDEKVTNT